MSARRGGAVLTFEVNPDRSSLTVAKIEGNQDQLGLAHWMRQALIECEHARVDFSAGKVHDLRVALRRCRSLAAVVQNVDPCPAWKRMRKAGKAVFSALGELRDVQVMAEWIHRLFPKDDLEAAAVLEFVASRELVRISRKT